MHVADLDLWVQHSCQQLEARRSPDHGPRTEARREAMRGALFERFGFEHVRVKIDDRSGHILRQSGTGLLARRPPSRC